MDQNLKQQVQLFKTRCDKMRELVATSLAGVFKPHTNPETARTPLTAVEKNAAIQTGRDLNNILGSFLRAAQQADFINLELYYSWSDDMVIDVSEPANAAPFLSYQREGKEKIRVLSDYFNENIGHVDNVMTAYETMFAHPDEWPSDILLKPYGQTKWRRKGMPAQWTPPSAGK